MEIAKGGEFNIEPTKRENKTNDLENKTEIPNISQNNMNNINNNIYINKNFEYPFQMMNPFMYNYMNPYISQFQINNRNFPYMNYMMYPNFNNNMYRRNNNVFPGMMPMVGNFPIQNFKMGDLNKSGKEDNINNKNDNNINDDKDKK